MMADPLLAQSAADRLASTEGGRQGGKAVAGKVPVKRYRFIHLTGGARYTTRGA